MSQAHLVISRAGAITLAEICAMGRAALLLPLSLAGSHQRVTLVGWWTLAVLKCWSRTK